MKFSRVAVVSIIIANLFPILGVVYFGWNLFTLLILYLLENVVIGFFTILKMVKAERPSISLVTKGGLIKGSSKRRAIFQFTLFYLGLTAIHGLIVFNIFGNELVSGVSVGLLLLGLFASHGISFLTNYIARKEYQKTYPDKISGVIFIRVILMHVFVLWGAFFISLTGELLYMLVSLAIFKLLIDLLGHLNEHKPFIRVATETEQYRTFGFLKRWGALPKLPNREYTFDDYRYHEAKPDVNAKPVKDPK